jgi:hypothetical protein
MPNYDCDHKYLFIGEERGTDRKSAYLCARCGTFRIWINGVVMTFWLVTPEQIEAAAMYARELKRTGMEPTP